MKLWAIAGGLMVLVACTTPPREAGPHADEEGAVTYWRVVSSDASSEDCTDAEDWAGTVAQIDFEPNSFIMYKVDAGGTTATGQSCDTLSAQSCTDSDQVYEISGSQLVYAAPPAALGDESCDVDLNAVWTVVDRGEEGSFTLTMTFSYADSEGCEALEAAIVAASTNGAGLSDCEIVSEVGLEFEQAI